ncbi:HNH endonuclease [Basfia succiniciproducens]|uniref:HNH endonuclease n=1 Tax=Basfia succiniciproducens TaxID=653940 RepID=A0A1G5BBE9_9PAST|nr:HNH endonuclease [Basfia succiniciproducens]QIM69795.1 hypothetical protein A4G13_00975 [Basfia succiniciproducens]SCX87449.1 HNH endonuclease [Basfia succiniciproducens]
MKKCIYCQQEKNENCFSLEHVIPQFLGGALVSDKFKTHYVCKSCNNNLGLFVDASFEKDWLVHNHLITEFSDFFDPKNITGLPLYYMGADTIQPPKMPDNHICELFLGPLGELIFWIRAEDERLYWYVGGNPRTAKEKLTTAYFLCTERTLKNPLLSLLSFKLAFENKRVRKIMCTEVTDCDLKQFGFSMPDEVDIERIEFFKNNINRGQLKFSKNINYDQRFMAKLSIGILHCLFPNSIFSNQYFTEMYKGLWYRGNEDFPDIRGCSEADDKLKELLGVPSGIAISVMCIDNTIALNLNIAQKLHWTIKCADIEELNEKDKHIIDDQGRVFIIYRAINKYIELPMLEFIMHKTKNCINQELKEIEDILFERKDYFKNL